MACRFKLTTALNDPYRVVLTSERAKVYFPSLTYEQMLGKTVIYDTLKTTVFRALLKP